MESKVSRRLTQAVAPEICEHIYLPRLNREFHGGFPYLSEINAAHLLMLHSAGLIPEATAARLAQALRQIEREGSAAVPLDPQREDAYFNYEARLMDVAGAEAGGRLHVARSRNDILATQDRLRARDAGVALMLALCDLRETVLDRALAYADCVMPGYTHLQAAQPITYGYYLAGVADALGRDTERVRHAVEGLDACPLGAGALAGTAFPIRREETARLLGFSTHVSNSLDAVASRDFAWEMLSAMTVAVVGWGRIAQDLYVWATPEFGLIEFPDGVAGTSSIMPQKKNPVALEYLKGKGGHLLGLFTAAMGALRGTHFTHSGDASRESMRGFWEATDETLRCVALLRLVLAEAIPRRDTMLQHVRDDFSMATDLADALVREGGVSFREAHHIVGAVVRDALDRDLPACEISTAMVDAAAHAQIGRPMQLSEAAVRRCLDPVVGVAARTVAGGPAPELVRVAARTQLAALEDVREEAEGMARRIADTRQQLKRATERLADAAA